MNKIEIVGRIANEIEAKTFGETKVVKNSVAVGRNVPDKDGNFLTDFINFTAFNRQAEYLEKHAQKGSLIEIVGALRVDNFEKDGEKKSATYVVVDYCKAYQTTSNTEYKKATSSDSFTETNDDTSKTNGTNVNVVDDDLPF